MSNGVNNLYEFGSFRLDGRTGTLWRGDDVVSLSPKALELLKLLIEHRGEVVSKQDIFDSVWSGTFVEDGVLTQNVYTLRNALGLDERERQFIETVPRRGYRFAGELKSVGINGPQGNAALAFQDETPTERIAQLLSSTPARSPIRLFLYAGLGLLILAAAGFGIYQIALRSDIKSESGSSPIEQLRFQRLTDSGDVLYPTISPDGDLLAYVRHGEEDHSVWVMRIATGTSVQMLPPNQKGFRSLTFSPDGNYLFFREERDGSAIYQTPVFGDTPKKVADNVWSDFSLSPDGSHFAFVRRDTARNSYLLILSNIDGSAERELSARPSPTGFGGGAPAWSPDGERLIISAGSAQQARPLLFTIDVASGSQTEFNTPNWRSISRVLWMPDGKNLIVTARSMDESASQLWLLGFPDGDVRRLTNDLDSYFWTSLSADGRTLVARQQTILSHLWLLPEGDVKRAKQLTTGSSNLDGYVGLAWTPEGKIVFSVRSGNVTDLQSINADGGDQVPLTANTGPDNTWPAATNDGRYIVFTSHRTGARQIWRMDADGRNQKQLTFGERPMETAHSAAPSPDGKEVFFIRIGDTTSAIWKVAIDGGTPVQVSQLTNATAEGFLSISPDGHWLAYRHVSTQAEGKSEERTIQIGVLPSDGNADPRLFDLPMRRTMVQWAADSATFDYAAGTFDSSRLLRQPLDDGEPQKLIDFPDRIFNFAWSFDRKNLVVARGQLRGDAVKLINLP